MSTQSTGPVGQPGGTWRVLIGDCRESMRLLPEASVQCCVTSPPYWGLRDYGHTGQLGLEQTPEQYVASMVDVFREVRRVLRTDGILWLNLGDSYAANRSYQVASTKGGAKHSPAQGFDGSAMSVPDGLKPKDLVGIPWRLAFALQADGWVLRSDVIWNKPNPMPESVTDRPTKSHEYLFMFAKAKWSGPQPGMFAHISDADARWLALFLDTEGNITVKRVERDGRKWYGAQIGFSGSHRPLLEAAQQIIGRGTVLERKGTNAPMYYLQLSNRQAADLLRRVYPFLIVKRRQARIAIHLQTLLKHRGGRGADRCRTEGELAVLESLWSRNKECNRFGSPDLLDVPKPMMGGWKDCERYYYDADAIAEPAAYAHEAKYDNGQNGHGGGESHAGQGSSTRKFKARPGRQAFITQHGGVESSGLGISAEITRNARTVWTIPTQPYNGAHFATFPPELAERCIKAGSKPGDIVLDPFAGSGTTGMVATGHGRSAILCELNPEYVPLIRERCGPMLEGAA